MATTAQILANRLKSRKSTGPQTEEGKATVSQNAVKHGIFTDSVIKNEDPADYKAFHDAMLADVAPVGAVIADLSNSRVLERLMLYERRIESSILKTMNELKRHEIMRRIEQQDADQGQYLHAQTIPKACGFGDATQSTQAYLSQRDEAATRSAPVRAIPIPINDNRDEAATPKAEKKGDLKKQTQFAPTLIGTTTFVKGDYDNNPAGGAEKNKAKQSQSPASAPTNGAGKSEKSLAAATG